MDFIAIGKAKKGDMLLNYDGMEEEIKSIEFVGGDNTVYNLEVKGNHNYFAENVLVHNKIGRYRGKDREVQASLDKDKVSWEAAQDSINLLNDRARDLMEQNKFQTETLQEQRKMEARTLAEERKVNVGQAAFQAGQAGLVTGEGTRNVETVQDTSSYKMDESRLAFERKQKEQEFGIENSLFDILQRQTDLYTNWIGQSSGSEYLEIPDMQQSYAGGAEWTPTTTDTVDISNLSGSCFTSDTKVDNKNISEIEVGDVVASYNTETKIIEKAEVVETFKHKHNNGYLVINGRVKATVNHPFYIRRNV